MFYPDNISKKNYKHACIAQLIAHIYIKISNLYYLALYRSGTTSLPQENLGKGTFREKYLYQTHRITGEAFKRKTLFRRRGVREKHTLL